MSTRVVLNFEQERDQLELQYGSFRPKKYHSIRKDLLSRKRKSIEVFNQKTMQRQATYLDWRQFLLEQKSQTFALSQNNKLSPQDMLLLFEAKKQQDQMKPSSLLFTVGGGYTPSPNLHRRTPSRINSDLDSCASYQLDSIENQMMNDYEDNTGSEIDSTYGFSEISSSYHKKLSEVYEFVGMHHIFEVGNNYATEVNVIKFAYDNNDLLAFGASDGTIYIATACKDPKIITTLQGHKDGILDFDWSLSNENILSVSRDATIRIWETTGGKCIREIKNHGNGICRCVRFLPTNNNFFVVGFDNGVVGLYNLSTGKLVDKLKVNKFSMGIGSMGGFGGFNINLVPGVGCSVSSLCWTHLGNTLFVGDVSGTLWIYDFDIYNTKFGKLLHKLKVSLNGKSITSIDFQLWTSSSNKTNPRLLLNTMDGFVHLYQYNNASKKFTETQRFPNGQKSHAIRSKFCPLVSFINGSCFVTGSESTEILFYSTKFGSSNSINRLMGHSSPVLDVSWSYDETLLASCDMSGVVILWKRRPLGEELDEQTASDSQ
ncbi:hypothetical protein ABK040_006286 [Willaertia magna]